MDSTETRWRANVAHLLIATLNDEWSRVHCDTSFIRAFVFSAVIRRTAHAVWRRGPRHKSLLENNEVPLTVSTRRRESDVCLTLVINRALFYVAFRLLERPSLIIWLKDPCLSTETTWEVIVRNCNFNKKIWVHITPVYFTGPYFHVCFLMYTIKRPPWNWNIWDYNEYNTHAPFLLYLLVTVWNICLIFRDPTLGCIYEFNI